MAEKTSPFLEAKWGWPYGSNGWNTGADENWLKFSYMFDRNVDGIVSSLPPAVNGQAYFNTTDNRFYFVVDGTYYSSPCPKWFIFVVRSSGETYQFDGSGVTKLATNDQLDSRLSYVEEKVEENLGPSITQPTSREDGTPLQLGDRYFNTTEDLEYLYKSTGWEPNNLEQRLLTDEGANLVGYGETNVAGMFRNLISPIQFGGIFDNTAHPLSEKFPTLAAAQAAYPGVWIDSLNKSIDYAATQAAILKAESEKSHVGLVGVGWVNDEIIIRKPINIFGTGPGNGYGTHYYTQHSGVKAYGTGTRRVRTRQRYRGSAADPQDDAMSALFNVQSGNVHFYNFSINLFWDNPAPGNFGDDWDIAVFVGTRVQFKMTNVHISSGYWRKAGLWIDVTQPSSSGAPRFKDPFGVRYASDGPHGADGCTLTSVYTYGGFWGVKVQGSDPAPGLDAFGPPYYDEEVGLMPDSRGGFGFSDFIMTACEIYGPEHTSFYRVADLPEVPSRTDVPVAGAFYISGLTSGSSGKIGGHRYVGCRFSSWEACRIYLGRTNRDTFDMCMQEPHGGNGRTTAGVPTTDSYGPVLRSPNSTNLKAVACASGFIGGIMAPFQLGDAEVTNDAGLSVISNLTLLADPLGGLTVSSDAGDCRVSASVAGELNLAAVSGQGLRVRSGATSIFTMNTTAWVATLTGPFRAAAANVASLGDATRPFLASTVTTRYYSATVFDTASSVDPEGVLTAGIGSTHRNTLTGVLKRKVSGTGNTGWAV